MRIKYINCLLLCLLVLIFVTQIILLSKSSSSCTCDYGETTLTKEKQNNDQEKKKSKTGKITVNRNDDKDSKIQQRDRLVFDPNTWIINNKVAQYGSKIILVDKDELIVEALAFFDFDTQTREYIQSKANKCLVKIDHQIHELPIYEALSMDTSIMIGHKRLLWRVRCRADKSLHQSRFSDILVALTDYDEYTKALKAYQSADVFVSFHTTNFYDSKTPKKSAVGHCVHMMFDLDGVRLTRFFNWFDVQRRLGIDRFRLYFFRVNKTSEEIIQKRVGDYVQIFHTLLGRDFICRHYIAYDTKHKSSLTKKLLSSCEKHVDIYFNFGRNGVFNAHEKVCTNDCLLNFKWQYEFTTNYDFDEFIFPRKYETNFRALPSLFPSSSISGAQQQQQPNQCNLNLDDVMNKPDPEYTVYEYAKRMKKLTNNQVAVLRFKHVLFMHNDHIRFLQKLFEINFATKDTSKQNVDYTYMNTNKRITFQVNSQDQKYVSEMRSSQALVDCLNKTIVENNFFESIWNTLYAIEVNNRFGKSIFDTNLTETYAQHYADVLAHGSITYDVPLSHGYASHFRELIDGFFYGQLYPLGNFYVDVEFYKFLATFK